MQSTTSTRDSGGDGTFVREALSTFVRAVLLGVCAASSAGASPIGSSGYQFGLHATDDSLFPYEGRSAQQGTFSFGAGTATGDLLNGGPDFLASMSATSSIAAADATSIFYDDLQFSVAGGGSASVQFHLAGSWHADGTGTVGVIFQLPALVYQGGWNWLAQMLSPEFDPIGGGWGYSTPYQVSDGQVVHLSMQLYASGFGAGSSAYIDDPISIQLPDGVTLASASGNTYAAVPAPAAGLLLITGLAAVAARSRQRV